MDNLWNILWTCVGLILTGLTTWGITALTAWLNTKIKDTKVRGYLDQIAVIAKNAMLFAEQTFVKQMKDGNKWSEAEYAQAMKVAVSNAESQLTADLRKWITDNYGDVSAYLQSQIESAIGATKVSA